jgi:ABC-type transporter Mla subunit MlaD
MQVRRPLGHDGSAIYGQMTVMAETDGRTGFARSGRERIQKLAQAALNADVTVDQVDAILAGLAETLEDLNNSTGNLDATLVRFNDTISRINDLAPRLNAVVDRLEGIVNRVERIVDIGEAVVAPLAATESAVRGAINAVRKTTRL